MLALGVVALKGFVVTLGFRVQGVLGFVDLVVSRVKGFRFRVQGLGLYESLSPKAYADDIVHGSTNRSTADSVQHSSLHVAASSSGEMKSCRLRP